MNPVAVNMQCHSARRASATIDKRGPLRILTRARHATCSSDTSVGAGGEDVAPKPSLGTLTLGGSVAGWALADFLLLGWEQVRIVPGSRRSRRCCSSRIRSRTASSPTPSGACARRRLFRVAPRRQRRVLAVRPGHLALAAGLRLASRRYALWPGGPLYGLGLWYSIPAALFVEFVLFGFGVLPYSQATRPRDRMGSVLFWIFVVPRRHLSGVGLRATATAVRYWRGAACWAGCSWPGPTGSTLIAKLYVRASDPRT